MHNINLTETNSRRTEKSENQREIKDSEESLFGVLV